MSNESYPQLIKRWGEREVLAIKYGSKSGGVMLQKGGTATLLLQNEPYSSTYNRNVAV